MVFPQEKQGSLSTRRPVGISTGRQIPETIMMRFLNKTPGGPLLGFTIHMGPVPAKAGQPRGSTTEIIVVTKDPGTASVLIREIGPQVLQQFTDACFQ